MSNKPPSRIRYEAAHPIISFRISKPWYDEMKQLLAENNISIADFFKISLNKQQTDFTEAYDKAKTEGFSKGKNTGYNEGFAAGQQECYNKGYAVGLQQGYNQGYDKAKAEYCIWFYCFGCDSALIIKSGSNIHRFIIDMLLYYRWGHPGCIHPY